jgi:hypothetical protein
MSATQPITQQEQVDEFWHFKVNQIAIRWDSSILIKPASRREG